MNRTSRPALPCRLRRPDVVEFPRSHKSRRAAFAPEGASRCRAVASGLWDRSACGISAHSRERAEPMVARRPSQGMRSSASAQPQLPFSAHAGSRDLRFSPRRRPPPLPAPLLRLRPRSRPRVPLSPQLCPRRSPRRPSQRSAHDLSLARRAARAALPPFPAAFRWRAPRFRAGPPARVAPRARPLLASSLRPPAASGNSASRIMVSQVRAPIRWLCCSCRFSVFRRWRSATLPPRRPARWTRKPRSPLRCSESRLQRTVVRSERNCG